MPEPLDANEVIKVCEGLRDQQSAREWRTVNETRHGILYRREPIDIPGVSLLLEDRSPTARIHADRYVNKLDAAEIVVQVSARSSERAAIEAAQRVENWDYTVHYDFKRRRSDHSYGADRRAIDQAVCYGAGIERISFHSDVLEMALKEKPRDVEQLRTLLPEAGFTANPFVLEAPHVNAVFWEPDLSTVCEVGERKVAQIMLAYEGKLSYKDGTFGWLTSDTVPEYTSEWDQQATVYHLETREYMYDVVRGLEGRDPLMLQFIPNVAGRPWYTIIPGNLTSEPNVVEGFQPLIANLYPLVEEERLLGTLINSGALLTGRNQFQEVAVGRAPETFAEIYTKPAEQRPVVTYKRDEELLPRPRAGYRWEPVPVPDQSQLIAAWQALQGRIADAGFPPILSAASNLSATSGYDRNQQRQAAAELLGPALQNLAAAKYEQFTLIGDIVRALDLPIKMPVHNRAAGKGLDYRELTTIKPEDFREQDLLVRYEAMPATDRYAERESDIRMLSAGRMSPQTFMARHYEDPVDEEEKIKLAQLEVPLDQMAQQDALTIIEWLRGNVMQEVAAEEQVPLAPEELAQLAAGQQQGVRNERPPLGAASPGLGAPNVPPVQGQPGEVIPGAGAGVTAEAQ